MFDHPPLSLTPPLPSLSVRLLLLVSLSLYLSLSLSFYQSLSLSLLSITRSVESTVRTRRRRRRPSSGSARRLLLRRRSSPPRRARPRRSGRGGAGDARRRRGRRRRGRRRRGAERAVAATPAGQPLRLLCSKWCTVPVVHRRLSSPLPPTPLPPPPLPASSRFPVLASACAAGTVGRRTARARGGWPNPCRLLWRVWLPPAEIIYYIYLYFVCCGCLRALVAADGLEFRRRCVRSDCELQGWTKKKAVSAAALLNRGCSGKGTPGHTARAPPCKGEGCCPGLGSNQQLTAARLYTMGNSAATSTTHAVAGRGRMDGKTDIGTDSRQRQRDEKAGSDRRMKGGMILRLKDMRVLGIAWSGRRDSRARARRRRSGPGPPPRPAPTSRPRGGRRTRPPPPPPPPPPRMSGTRARTRRRRLGYLRPG